MCNYRNWKFACATCVLGIDGHGKPWLFSFLKCYTLIPGPLLLVSYRKCPNNNIIMASCLFLMVFTRYIRVCGYVRACACVCVRVRACACVRACVRACVCHSSRIRTHKHKHRLTYIQTHTNLRTHTNTHAHTHSRTHIHTHIHTHTQ